MSLRRLRQEVENINATISMAARELAATYDALNDQQRSAFLARIRTLDERAKAVQIAMDVLDKTK